MLKLLGIVLVVFSCTAMGWNQSIAVENRLRQLREIEKLVHLILGEITYRKETLPEVLLHTSRKAASPFDVFLREVAQQASLYQGECFSGIFRKQAEECLKNSNLTANELETFMQLGEYLGWLDIEMQRNTMALYLEQLKQDIGNLSRELPARKKICRSLGVMAGIFLAIILL